jgi:glucokinase
VPLPAFAVGVDLGGTNLKVGLVHRADGVVEQARVTTGAEHGPGHILDRMAEAVEQVRRALPAGAALAGIGVGAPGSVSLDRAVVASPPNFPGWGRVDVAAELRGRLGALDGPVLVENDANVAGLGSAFYGAGRPFDSFLMATLGTGVGGAILVNKRLFRGAHGAAGELGHVSIDYEGPYARSGVAGAVEAYLGQHFLSRHARYRLLARETRLRETAGPDLADLDPHQLHLAAEAGDAGAAEVLAWAGHKLGVALGSAVNLLDIRKVVVGGGVSAAGEFLLGPARAALHRSVMPGMQEGLELVRETMGNEVALLGAARLVFEHQDDLTA